MCSQLPSPFGRGLGIGAALRAQTGHPNPQPLSQLGEGKYSASICFAAFRTIKENPDRKIIAEVFKTVFDSRGREQNVVWREGLSRSAADKLSAALRDDVNFVQRMERLRITAARRVELHDQRAEFEQQHGLLALRTGQTFERCAQR